MATTAVALAKDVWTLIASDSCALQNLSNTDVYVTERAALPSPNKLDTVAGAWKLVKPGQMFNWTKVDGNLYGCPNGVSAAISIN